MKCPSNIIRHTFSSCTKIIFRTITQKRDLCKAFSAKISCPTIYGVGKTIKYDASQGRFISSEPKSRGLFGIEELKKPSDFLRSASLAMSQCDQLRSSLENIAIESTSDAVNVLYRLDEISRVVCNVIDAAELCRNVHADAEWREAAHRAFSTLSDYIAQLNADKSLYEALTLVTSNTSIMNQLGTEEQRFVDLLQAEFERDGIHLPDSEREQVRRIQNHVTDLESLFSQNLIRYNKTFLADAKTVQAVIPRHVLDHFGVPVSNAEGLLELNDDQQILQTLIKFSESPSLRKQAYIESTTSVSDNIPVLEALVRTRHELAIALGFESFAERALRDKMAQHPSHVNQFLEALLKTTKPFYKKEMEIISKTKQSFEGSSVIEPWDVTFYVSALKARDGFDINTVSKYLTLTNCLHAMKSLVAHLFGIDMVEDDLTHNERWDDMPSDHGQRIRRFIFSSENGKSLGTMYLDLYPRTGKFGHAAHFTIRCGCLVNGPEESKDYQDPIVALVCNLSPGEHLTHSEVETLFHEFGHALHSLLSRTEFQHMSGTRAPMDFVETPSHLFENYVWDREFLQQLAIDPNTSSVIPDITVEQLRRQRYEFNGIEKLNQIIYAQFDQRLHSAPPSGNDTSTAIFARLHHEHGVPYAEGTHWHSRFGHLVSYGAGYYGYLYSQVFAGDIWRQLFEGNSLNRSSGHLLWHKLLIHGGARDPTDMLTDLLGRPPKVVYF